MTPLDQKILEATGWKFEHERWFLNNRQGYPVVTLEMLVEVADKQGPWGHEYDGLGTHAVRLCSEKRLKMRSSLASAIRAALAAHWGIEDENKAT